MNEVVVVIRETFPTPENELFDTVECVDCGTKFPKKDGYCFGGEWACFGCVDYGFCEDCDPCMSIHSSYFEYEGADESPFLMEKREYEGRTYFVYRLEMCQSTFRGE